MGSGLLLVPIHTDGEEYTLEGTLVSGRPPALENLSSSSQEGLFPSVFGAKTPFLDFSITFQPLLHLNCWYCTEKCLGSSKCCWRTNLDGQGDFFFFPSATLLNQVVHQGLNYLTTSKTHPCQAQGCRFTFILSMVCDGQPRAKQEAAMQS